jgi:glycerol-3-phosphate acyltransferase PlsY
MDIIEIIRIILLVITSYLIGSIPFCNIIAKIHSNKDLREIGDGNPGGWNLVFNISKYWGAVGIALDLLKGFFPYLIVLKITGIEIAAIIAGCAAVAGHNYSPYMKLSGGKGMAATIGLLFSISPYTIIAFGISILFSLFLIRNMIWAVILSIVFSGIFLCLIKDSLIYLIMVMLLLIIIVPRYINHSIAIGINFKFRKEKTLKDLFTPKVR